MKKVYFILMLICTIGAFSACSDDDDEIQNPVTNPQVQQQVEIGQDFTITGTGFTADSKIFLRDNDGKSTALPVKNVSGTEIVVSVPATMAAGVYKVILQQNGEWELGTITLSLKNPITEYSVPAKVIKGMQLKISGVGFADNCEVYLRPVLGDAISMGKADKVEGGIAVTIPEDFKEGSYTVLVKQNGDWELGTTEVIAEVRILIEKKSVEKFWEDGEVVDEMAEPAFTTTLKYDIAGRVTAIQRVGEYTDEQWQFTYTDQAVVMEISGTRGDEAIENKITFTLENGRVIHSSDTLNHEENTWSYTPAGYLEAVVNSSTSEDVIAGYSYENNQNINTCNYSGFTADFGYKESGAELNNQSGMDLWAYLTESVDFPEVTIVARMLGICGKYPVHLPNGMDSDWGMYEISYTSSADKITSIVMSSKEEEDPGVIYEQEINYKITY